MLTPTQISRFMIGVSLSPKIIKLLFKFIREKNPYKIRSA